MASKVSKIHSAIHKYKRVNVALAIVVAVSVGIVGYTLLASRAATIKPADLNNDSTVNIFDLSILLGKWNQGGTQAADLNADNTVNIFDLSILLSQWGTSPSPTPLPPAGTCTVPERVTVTTANKSTYPAYPVGAKVYVPMGPDPWGGCFPGPNNTGYPQGKPGDTRTPVTLTPYTGPCTITTANVVIDKKEVNCDLDVRAQNLIITNSKITGRVYLDDTRCSTASFSISDSTVHVPYRGTRAFMYCNYTVTRVDASGGGSMAMCSSCTIKDSYLHDPLEDPTGHDHNSTVRIGPNATIEHNMLWCNVRSIQSTDGSGESSGCSANQTGYSHDGLPPHNSTMRRNFYAAIPDGYCAYGGSTGGAGANQVHDIKYFENIFQRGSYGNDWQPTKAYICGYYGPITSLDNLPGNEFTGNTWDNGKPLSPEQNTWADVCGSDSDCTW
jgi:hypothetical protein